MSKFTYKKIIVFLLVFISVVGITMLYRKFRSDSDVKKFSVYEFRNEIGEFSAQKVLGDERYLGEIVSDEEAMGKVEEIWLEVFGNTIVDEKPYLVYYDSNEKVWLVLSSGPSGQNILGGTAKALIRKKDGKVLAIWHTQ